MVNYLVSDSVAGEWGSTHFSDGKTEVPAVVEFLLCIYVGLDSISSTKKKKRRKGRKKRRLDMVVQVCNPRDLEAATGDLEI